MLVPHMNTSNRGLSLDPHVGISRCVFDLPTSPSQEFLKLGVSEIEALIFPPNPIHPLLKSHLG